MQISRGSKWHVPIEASCWIHEAKGIMVLKLTVTIRYHCRQVIDRNAATDQPETLASRNHPSTNLAAFFGF